MDMDPKLQAQVVFHLTGRRNGDALESIEGRALRPALFAQFNDLTRLRYDYPVVLLEAETGAESLRSLSGLIDGVAEKLAPAGAADAERLRKHLLRLEREIRALLAGGARGRLSELWQQAAERLVAAGGEALGTDLARARTALGVDGELLDCDRGAPARLVTHVWRSAQDAKTRAMRRTIDELKLRLSGLVRADYMRSEEGRHAETLRAGIGAPHQALFDFDAMAQLLAKPSGASALSESRRRRIERVLATLESERFFAPAGGYGYAFAAIEPAVSAFRERLPAMVELVRAIAIAELEAEGSYVEAKHDAYFEGFDAASLGDRDLGLFPDYFVCVEHGEPARAALIDALSSTAPLKILVQTHAVIDGPPLAEAQLGLGARLAASMMGLNEVYVLQAASSQLYRARTRIDAAMRFAGPALLSVYSGTCGEGIPPYLVAAAAQQSRAFPAFSYDPGAGPDWAQRFSLEDNPQPDRAWPVHEFAYADEAMQRVTLELPFTLADFAACDPRHARHFADVPREQWNGNLVTAGEWLEHTPQGGTDTLPCVYAVDADDRLHKLIVDEKLAHAARRCAEAWRRLQELDGLKRERMPAAAAPAAPAAEAAASAPAAPAPAAAAAPAAAPAPVEAEPAERDPNEAYIETERCTSCNECTQISGELFAYNENKQAYIANPSAGTYRQLVEAAENCQVSIIHPGKPRNPKEPGLDELVARAEPFL